ncbi:hypothetical protein JR316_0003134 [Psilocybe cubensis]|uniref:Uncharacterized protein n=2 Tax=Psilocybe cubensis TaxID=181762 RepID=A0A8H8CLN4_PSICU|nr:hypothetical protein JR316_0003134 [Psilocybe cubensis]KAH9483664.1 hypothetical protein JR316_0003134 [Psilocybe cubensis]
MTLPFTAYALFLAGHLFVILLTHTRLSFRIKRSFLWWDDLFSVFTMIVNAYFFVRTYVIVTSRVVSLHGYRLELGLAIEALCLSRTSLLLSPTRLTKERPSVVSRARLLSVIILVMGSIFASVTAFAILSSLVTNTTIAAAIPGLFSDDRVPVNNKHPEPPLTQPQPVRQVRFSTVDLGASTVVDPSYSATAEAEYPDLNKPTPLSPVPSFDTIPTSSSPVSAPSFYMDYWSSKPAVVESVSHYDTPYIEPLPGLKLTPDDPSAPSGSGL